MAMSRCRLRKPNSCTSRDRVCTFPGCHHERNLDAHHIEHWADGGSTSLDNLLVLCSTHHRLVHEGGFNVARDRDGHCYFVRPDGRPVEAPPSSATERVEEARAQYRAVLHSAEYRFRGNGGVAARK